jgi:DNA-binding IclR family transcriptional regulator
MITDKSNVQSIEKAVSILNLFTEHGEQLTLQDIHLLTGYNKTTTLRFCSTLVKVGFLEKIYEGTSPYYRLGIRLFTLGSRVLNRIDIGERARRYLVHMTKTLDINAYVFIEREERAICIGVSRGAHYYRDMTAHIGDIIALNVGGGPLAILGFMHPDKQLRIVERLALTPAEREQLLARLGRIRTQGYAVSHNEFIMNTMAIGAPVLDHEGEVIAALSVGSMDSFLRDTAVRERATRITCQAAQALSREIGWSGAVEVDEVQ